LVDSAASLQWDPLGQSLSLLQRRALWLPLVAHPPFGTHVDAVPPGATAP
jgi:hypothetical protein